MWDRPLAGVYGTVATLPTLTGRAGGVKLAAARRPLLPGTRAQPDDDVKTGNSAFSIPSRGAVAEQVTEALESAAAGEGLGVAAVPLSARAPTAVLETIAPSEPAVVWHPPGEAAWYGVGAAAEMAAAGPERFGSVRSAALQLWPQVSVRPVASAVSEPPSPRVFGGARFVASAERDPMWGELGDAWFMLPRFSAVQDGHESWLLVAESPGCSPDERRELARVAERLVTALDTATPRELSSPRLLRRHESDRRRWQLGVERICETIRAGTLEKVVTARWTELELEREIEMRQVLLRLAHECPECTRFAVRRRGVSFVGATPERLVARHGRAVTSQALAGSMSTVAQADADSPMERLMSCQKNRGEHQLVVDSIRRTLEPLCLRLDVPDTPSVLALRSVLHLASQISGELDEETHILRLVDALHPTPAVGGAPKIEALRWIADHEPMDRGWYAGPIGWFDADGNGDFAVAIRSALIHGNRARVFAGAGIVDGSEPVAELRETVLKQRAMVHGLGLEWECDGCPGPS